jgi:hypothetical protein
MRFTLHTRNICRIKTVSLLSKSIKVLKTKDKQWKSLSYQSRRNSTIIKSIDGYKEFLIINQAIINTK